MLSSLCETEGIMLRVFHIHIWNLHSFSLHLAFGSMLFNPLESQGLKNIQWKVAGFIT